MAISTQAKPKRPMTPKQREALRLHAIRPGQVLNAAGGGASSAARRFREALERAATDKDLAEIAKRIISRARAGKHFELALVLDRLWPKVDRLELGAIGESEAHEREAARARLQRLLDGKGRPEPAA